jgi:lauroyl/myristoyl acyltransferase
MADVEAVRLILGSRLARLLGPWRYVVADVAGRREFRHDRERRRRTILNHLRRDPASGISVARERARASFIEYVRTKADFLRLAVLSVEELRSEVTLEGEEHLEAARSGAAIIAMCHHGSWDVAASMTGALGLRVTAVMAAVGSPTMTRFVTESRARYGLELHPPRDSARAMLRALRAGRCVGVMCDIPEEGPTVVVDFCSGPVRFTAVAARLARRTGAAIIPVDCWREDRRYRLHIRPPLHVEEGEDDIAVTQRLARGFEATIAALPEQWYPFHDVFADTQHGGP